MVEKPPKVLISYAHGDERRMAAVLALANQLRADGVDVIIDRYVPRPERGWDNWMLEQLQNARFVLIVCDETYKRRFEGNAPRGEGLGVTWEGAIITSDLYQSQLRNTKYIPVLLQIEDRPHIPTILGNSSFRAIGFGPYDLKSCQGYIQLYRDLADQPEVLMPELGLLKALEPLPVKSTGADFKLQPVSRVRHTLTLWLQPRGDEYRYQFIHWRDTKRARTKLDRKGTGTLSEVQRVFQICLGSWDKSYGDCDSELITEFALPLADLSMKFDDWLSHTDAPLVEERPIVVRWAAELDSLEDKRSETTWKQRWNAMLAFDGRTHWRDKRLHRPTVRTELGRAVRGNRDAFCVSFVKPPDLKELREALCDGIPIAIWPCAEHADVDGRLDALTQKPPTDLPEHVRCDCCELDDQAPKLALLWDDPRRRLKSHDLLAMESVSD